MTYEAWRISYQDPEQAARAAYIMYEAMTEQADGWKRRCIEKETTPESTSKVLYQIAEERQRQDEKWGGPANDDQWNALDWHEMLADYNAWARRMACMGSLDKARRRYVQLAALAVAAVEAIDRKAKVHTVAPNGGAHRQ